MKRLVTSIFRNERGSYLIDDFLATTDVLHERDLSTISKAETCDCGKYPSCNWDQFFGGSIDLVSILCQHKRESH